jgi:hypothetical protein
MLEQRLVGEGRAVLARLEPEYEYDQFTPVEGETGFAHMPRNSFRGPGYPRWCHRRVPSVAFVGSPVSGRLIQLTTRLTF